jgi:hypothetical protein
MVLIVRPGYRIGSRTIKRGSRVSNLIVSFGESSNLCILGIIFIGSYLSFIHVRFWYVSNVSIIFDAHAYFYTICLVFHYTSWHFYAFSETNLLTRCHSASSLFSAIFVFQKSYTRNILGIGQNKSRTSGNLLKLPENWRGDGGGPWAGHTIGWRGLPLARAPWWWGRPGPPLMLPLRL